ncbi:uncharacterized protein LOC108670118 [Hyalella azteca]|uniref:Uncharacterized protein LOC108670118 n=1 Tax=Hyalella azteca TaxID=294128 RepID=A0A8B7NI70_HYAAZ|nr:uncharacterized protein LOC108670118 [Hyalella azteca]XP_018013057.1 uncharacterized protein LOC108670118 [Hyalella azteca]XP_047740211.1 uncharacterized protein LOC108670118 [Hyalella azteca]
MATETKPMDEFEEESITMEIEDIAAKYNFDESLRGKWMLFFLHEYMDDMWAKAVELYSAGELPGIVSIKTSTAAPNVRSGETEYGVIRFYCGPYDDRERVLQYGLKLIEKMQYFSNNFGFAAYKTDEQSKIGTKATGAKKNYLYRLPVSTYDHLEQRSGKCKEPPIEVPSQVCTRELIHEVVGDFIRDPVDISNYCRWTMEFPSGTPHDSAWVSACRLYRSGELKDVDYIQTTTVKSSLSKNGMILFFSRDNLSQSKLQQCGNNLVQKLDYSSKDGELCASQYIGRGWVVLCRVPASQK